MKISELLCFRKSGGTGWNVEFKWLGMKASSHKIRQSEPKKARSLVPVGIRFNIGISQFLLFSKHCVAVSPISYSTIKCHVQV